MGSREFLGELVEDPDSMYDRAIDDMAYAIMAMSAIHDKPLEEIGKDLNTKVEELMKKENETCDWIKEFFDGRDD